MKKRPFDPRKFLAGWGKDLVPVALGAVLGLVLALVLTSSDTKETRPGPPDRTVSQSPPPAPSVAVVPPPPPPQIVAPVVPPLLPPPLAAPAWQRLATPVGPNAGRAMVAVVIDDMGVDRRRSDRAVKLPGPLTLSYLTYARDLPQQTAAARAAGHELLVHIPMEPEGNGSDPGPNVLRTGLDPAELDRRIEWALTRFDGFVGINNHMGSRFTKDAVGMARVMAALEKRGLLWLDSRTTPKTAGPRTAREAGVPFAERSVFLDNENDSSEVRARLSQLERLARQSGYAVAIGHPREATLTALSGWLPTLDERGLMLVPVSAVVRHRLEVQRKAVGIP